MAKSTPWEYAILTQQADQHMLQIEYGGPHQVAEEDVPKGTLVFTLGALGSKGWELVSVESSWQGEGVHVTKFYFKRQHDDDRKLKD
jgi:hypothetical protein